MNISVLVLLRDIEGKAPLPEETVLGSAALSLEPSGIHLIFNDFEGYGIEGGELTVTGLQANPGGWKRVSERPISACRNRHVLLWRHRPEYRQLESLFQRKSKVLANPWKFINLCRDKPATIRHMRRTGINIPEIVSDVDEFDAALKEWGAAFFKPRFGACGKGVIKFIYESGNIYTVTAERGLEKIRSEGLKETLLRCDSSGSFFLQRSIKSLNPGRGGMSVRSLVQREVDGTWKTISPIVRFSESDPVCNAARGAAVTTLSEFLQERSTREQAGRIRARIEELDRLIARSFKEALGKDYERIIEMGIDYIIDPEQNVYFLEVNDTPQGNLSVLARQRGRESGEYKIFQECLKRPFYRLRELVWNR